LWSLLDVFAALELPVDLAVIPSVLSDGLAHELSARIEATPHLVGLHQHGFAHRNHETVGRKYEFGPSRSCELQCRDIAEGRTRLVAALGPVVDSAFTPPWNRCTRTTGHCLVALGFTTLSREWRARPFGIPGLEEKSIRVDWCAHDRGRRLSRDELGVLLARAVEDTRAPVGVMFHHAVMDAYERRAARDLLSVLAHHPNARARLMMPSEPQLGRRRDPSA
jgi:hypothetical protein